ncbi:MAG: DUF2029 domain-containing protein [Candidatus Dormibacteraeota bacterium]|nr:DUF2029 domain-containing protein [Candidatus Dormibacteraeota bacterium]
MTRRLDRWLLAGALALSVAGFAAVATQSRPARESADFTFYFAAALLVRDGNPAGVYDQATLDTVIQRIAPTSPVDPRLTYNLPLAAAFPVVPLTALPLEFAFRAWQLASVVLLLAAVLILQRIFPIGRTGVAMGTLALAASVPTWAILTEGQMAPLPVLGATLMVAMLRLNRPWLAFGGGMLLAVKPHFLPIYLIMLVAAGRWRGLLAALSGATLVLLSPLLAGGLGGVAAMLRNIFGTNALVPVRYTEAWIGLLAHVVPAQLLTPFSVVLYLVTLTVLATLALRSARRGGPLPIAVIAVIGWVGLLASPHALPHDLLILGPPTWLAFLLVDKGRLPSIIPALFLIDLALLIDIRGAGIVLGPLAITAVALWAGWEFRRRVARQRLQTAAAA